MMKRNLESFFRALRSDVAEDVLASEICLWKLFLQTWFYLDEISVKKNAGWMEDGWKVGPRATGAWEFRFPRSRTWFNFSETGRRFIYSTNDVEISIGLGCPPESIDGTSVESIDFRTPRQGHPASLHVFTDLNPDHPLPLPRKLHLMSKNWRKARQRGPRNIKVLTSWAERILVADWTVVPPEWGRWCKDSAVLSREYTLLYQGNPLELSRLFRYFLHTCLWKKKSLLENNSARLKNDLTFNIPCK